MGDSTPLNYELPVEWTWFCVQSSSLTGASSAKYQSLAHWPKKATGNKLKRGI